MVMGKHFGYLQIEQSYYIFPHEGVQIVLKNGSWIKIEPIICGQCYKRMAGK
jgi:hypothetical protein